MEQFCHLTGECPSGRPPVFARPPGNCLQEDKILEIIISGALETVSVSQSSIRMPRTVRLCELERLLGVRFLTYMFLVTGHLTACPYSAGAALSRP